MKRPILSILLVVIMILSSACQKDIQKESHQSDGKSDIYVSDEEKKQWRDAIVKLISNQDEAYGEHGEIMGYEPPRPDEPSIACGIDMGLFDVNVDGVPELLLNHGGGSAGNDFFSVYDILSGEHLGTIDGGGNKAWNIYYDIENDCFLPIGRYDWRSGDSGSMHYITTIRFSEEDQSYYEKTLFYSSYEYDKNYIEHEDGKIGGIELSIADVDFQVDGEPSGFQGYHYDLTEFYQQHSLVPHTGLLLYYWGDVSEKGDSYQERAEKMADMLLFGSGQQFVKVK